MIFKHIHKTQTWVQNQENRLGMVKTKEYVKLKFKENTENQNQIAH